MGDVWSPYGVEANRKSVQVPLDEQYVQGLNQQQLNASIAFPEFEEAVRG